MENIPSLTDDEYALIRRQGLGASDSSILLGVNPYKTKDQLIIEKRSKHITDEERAVKLKDAVRKGFDLVTLGLSRVSAEAPYVLPLAGFWLRFTDPIMHNTHFRELVNAQKELCDIITKR